MQAFNFNGYTEDEVRTARAAYYGLITYMDDKIGRLLDALEDTGMSDNTVVIHTSDHGESLGEHGLWRKMNFYEQSARVPLQISWPGVIEGGQRFSGAVSLVDATATILDMASVDQTSQSFMNLDGTSLLPQMTGSANHERDEAFSEHLAHGTDRPRAMLRQGRWKLSYTAITATTPRPRTLQPRHRPRRIRKPGQRRHTLYQSRTASPTGSWTSGANADALDHRIKDSQRSRLMIREVLGEGATF